MKNAATLSVILKRSERTRIRKFFETFPIFEHLSKFRNLATLRTLFVSKRQPKLNTLAHCVDKASVKHEKHSIMVVIHMTWFKTKQIASDAVSSNYKLAAIQIELITTGNKEPNEIALHLTHGYTQTVRLPFVHSSLGNKALQSRSAFSSKR